MSIYRLADASLETNPEVMVVHKEMFRSFTLKGGSQYPIAFRGDDRTLDEIMKTGFRPRKSVLAKYANVRKGGHEYARLREIRAELETKFGGEPNRDELVDEYLSSMIAVNVGNVDIDKDTAVCCTRDFKIAGMFPFDPNKSEVLEKPTRVYVVRLRGWFETYRMQAYLAPQLTYSQEVACLGIPVEDIIGCVMVNRQLVDNRVVMTLGGSEEPGEADESENNVLDKILGALPKDLSVPVPKQKEEPARPMPLGEKIEHITAAVRGLTGKGGSFRDLNEVRNDKVTELDDYRPAAKRKEVFI